MVTTKMVPANTVRIYMAGDFEQALACCRKYAFETGFCVTVTPTEYVYTGGQESGVIVEAINYARFPSEPDALLRRMTELAAKLRIALCQHSFTIQTPTESEWFSWREQN